MSDNILTRIQAEIHAPKGKRNEFGKFNYRSAEDILSAAKPIHASYDQSLVISYEIVQIGDRYYVKATAVIHPLGANSVAFAREQLDKKGMDQAQITGSASSYARKYALAGLFALDNEEEPDNSGESEKITDEQVEQIESLVKKTKSDKAKFLAWLGVKELNEIGAKNFDHIVEVLNKKLPKGDNNGTA